MRVTTHTLETHIADVCYLHGSVVGWRAWQEDLAPRFGTWFFCRCPLTRRCFMGHIRRNTAKIATVAKARSRKRATDEERA